MVVAANRIIGTKIVFEDLPGLILNQLPLYKISNIIEKYINKINPNIFLYLQI